MDQATNECYLAEGVYAVFDGVHIRLDCRDQKPPDKWLNRPATLELAALLRLDRFVERCHTKE